MSDIMAAALAFCVGVAAVANAGGEPSVDFAGTTVEVIASLWLLLGGALSALVAWLGAKLNGWLSEKKKDAWWTGIIRRFNTALGDGLLAAKAQVDARLREAKAEDSPGGAKITKAELDEIKASVWSFLKDRYGGMGGLERALGVAVGGNVEQWVGAKIDGALNEIAAEDPR